MTIELSLPYESIIAGLSPPLSSWHIEAAAALFNHQRIPVGIPHERVRAIVDAVPQIASQRTSLALSTIGTGIQLAVSYSIDVSRGGNGTTIVNRFVLDVLKFCEQLDIRASA